MSPRVDFDLTCQTTRAFPVEAGWFSVEAGSNWAFAIDVRLLSGFKGSTGIGTLMAMITLFLRAPMTTVTVNNAAMRINKTPSQE